MLVPHFDKIMSELELNLMEIVRKLESRINDLATLVKVLQADVPITPKWNLFLALPDIAELRVASIKHLDIAYNLLTISSQSVDDNCNLG